MLFLSHVSCKEKSIPSLRSFFFISLEMKLFFLMKVFSASKVSLN